MVMGKQNYYRLATNISKDFGKLNREVMKVFTNRLGTQKGNRLKRRGREPTETERKRYGKSQMMRFVSDEPIYPIGYVQHKNPMSKKRSINCYTPEGREEIHNNLRTNIDVMLKMMRQPLHSRSTEYADNRISLFAAQWGKCSVTGQEFTLTEDIHCRHKIPKGQGGTDKYENLTMVLEPIHKLIHATKEVTIAHYKAICNLNAEQFTKLNKLRGLAGLGEIA